ncbi:OmpA family protein [Pontibacter diazotrophicus]|uniref:OmpA family protein n=1 Tax=Pontibacter diazotrophicus TaxID=1400979 RepID=A0A3D8L7P5_9BACT|nr:OmpA family protein [Pontibacter diazotrophicus]RDV13418.1 OmpA family protein [Pontibacter diazotrophicus]
MKKRVMLYGCCALLSLLVLPAQAQFNIGKKLQNKVNQKVDQQINKTVDAAFEAPKKGATAGQATSETESEAATANTASGAEGEKMSVGTKYDFVAGDKVIFEDNLVGEENGEFPSRWDLKKGNAEVASFGGETVINLVETGTSIVPLVKRDKWVPETFTIEFDIFFDSDNPNVAYEIFLLEDTKNHNESLHGDFWYPIAIRANGVRFRDFGSESKELEAAGVKSKWRHVAIAFNKRSMKVYLDQYRLINIPNVKGTPTGFRIELDKRIEANTMVKNVMIAEGGKKLYDQVMADGKIVSYGIKFDVNKAFIKPESIGTLNSIVKLLQEQSALNFSVEGHTDSDGDDNTNMKLSQERAEAVKAYLVSQGITAERLSSKGWGEFKPLDKNTTAEAKSNNRRVEFVKL